jgi:hypothetical protein
MPGLIKEVRTIGGPNSLAQRMRVVPNLTQNWKSLYQVSYI